MQLFTSLPARKDGTLNVALKDGTEYTFTGTPLTLEVADEDHFESLQDLGFMTKEEFEAEQTFMKQVKAREDRAKTKAAPVVNGDADEDDFASTPGGLPTESNTAPTGRVRRIRNNG